MKYEQTTVDGKHYLVVKDKEGRKYTLRLLLERDRSEIRHLEDAVNFYHALPAAAALAIYNGCKETFHFYRRGFVSIKRENGTQATQFLAFFIPDGGVFVALRLSIDVDKGGGDYETIRPGHVMYYENEKAMWEDFGFGDKDAKYWHPRKSIDEALFCYEEGVSISEIIHEHNGLVPDSMLLEDPTDDDFNWREKKMFAE